MSALPISPSPLVRLEPDFEPAEWALDVLRQERAAIDAVLADPPAALGRAVAIVAEAQLPVLCCGVGKSGLVAAKVAATLSSLGTPAFPLSAGDGAHGDLGAVMPGSVVLLFSNSGATAEILRILPALRARACTLIGLVGRAASPLGRGVDLLLPLPIAREADHLDMAPTASTTLQMAMGDAIAVAASRLRDFDRNDFIANHPAGQLGQQALPVGTIMRTGGAMPTVLPHAALAQTVHVMSRGKMGATCVVDWSRQLLGLIVDSDVRRLIQERGDFYDTPASRIMRPDPQVIDAETSVGDALAMMTERSISVLPVTDPHGHLCGMIHMHDLMQVAR